MLINVKLQVVAPQGGFYLFPDFQPYAEKLRAKGIKTSDDLCARILEDTGVAILPGREFGRPKYEYTARLAYVNFDGDEALKAASDLEKKGQVIDEAFLREYCGETLTAIKLICEWVESL
jgi:aspartate aminotransferase